MLYIKNQKIGLKMLVIIVVFWLSVPLINAACNPGKVMNGNCGPDCWSARGCGGCSVQGTDVDCYPEFTPVTASITLAGIGAVAFLMRKRLNKK